MRHPRCRRSAEAVAAADRDEDEGKGWIPGPLTSEAWSRPGPHFPNDSVMRVRLQGAFERCDLGELGRALHSLQDAIAHSGLYGIPAVHAVTGPLADITAAWNRTLVDAAVDDTFSILRSFQQKCLRCCN